MKQYKVSYFSHYIVIPIKHFIIAVCRFFNKMIDRITGRWWCAGCKEYHHGRIYSFSCDDFLSDGICGLHLEKKYMNSYRFIRDGHKMSAREKRDLQNRVNSDLTEQ